MSDKMSIEEYRTLIGSGTKAKKHKYNAKKTVVDEIVFDSEAEANRYGKLKLLQKAKKIGKIILQYEFDLGAGITYKCDFLYIDFELKQFVVEDVKGVKTPEYKLKKKLLKEVYGIEVYETK